MVSRAIFVLLSGLAGMALFIKAEPANASYWLFGTGIGAVTGGLIVAGEYALRNLSFGIIVGGTGGLAVGLLLTGLVEWVGGEIFDVQTFLFPKTAVVHHPERRIERAHRRPGDDKFLRVG